MYTFDRYFGVFIALSIICLYFLIAYLPVILKYIQVSCHALQFVLYPYSLISRRQDFEQGMELVLTVMSFGMMNKTEKARRTAARWIQLVESVEQE